MKKKQEESTYQLTIAYKINNHKRIIAIVIAIAVMTCFPFFLKFYHFLNDLLYENVIAKWFSPKFFLPESSNGLAEILTALTEHAVFALLVYALFTDVIERWLGHQLREVPKFNSKRFIEKIKKSNENIIIQETFVRELLGSYREEFKKSLETFLDNCVKSYPGNLQGRIKVLVLHPFCEELKFRYKELENAIDIKPLEQFLSESQKLLIAMQDIQNSINNYAESHIRNKNVNFFELKISYEKPSFSLYYTDKYASISFYDKIPSVLAPQIVFNDANLSEVVKKQRLIFEGQWERAVFLPKDYYDQKIDDPNDIKKFEEIITNFKSITLERERMKIKEKLLEIADICDKNHLFALELVNYLESNHKTKKVNYEDMGSISHFNIFGTGGDDESCRTINISTISSILASHYQNATLGVRGIPVVKSGTLAVTGKVGSQQFYEELQSMRLNNESAFSHILSDQLAYLDYNSENRSTYLPITYFGYIYREIVRRVRKEINRENKTDIFKIIFTTANLTGYKGIINGVSKAKYLPYFKCIYANKRKTGIILHNKKEMDELFLGTNLILYYKEGICVHEDELQITVPDDQIASYLDFFKESYATEHVKKFFKLFDKNDESTTKEIRQTIAYNVALFLQLNFLATKEYSSNSNNDVDLGNIRLTELMESVYKQFFVN